MIHWTEIEKSKEGIHQILEVIKNYEKEGEVRFIAGIQSRHFSEYKIQQLICIVRERLNMSRRELLRLSETHSRITSCGLLMTTIVSVMQRRFFERYAAH